MRCFGLLVTLLHISSKTADDIVENNDKVILPGLEEETFCCTTKKWKFVDVKFTYKKTVWFQLLWTKWASGKGDGQTIHWSLLAWVQIPSLSFF